MTWCPLHQTLYISKGCVFCTQPWKDGIAGHKEEDIKPLFKNAPDNVWLPNGWNS